LLVKLEFCKVSWALPVMLKVAPLETNKLFCEKDVSPVIKNVNERSFFFISERFISVVD